MHGIRNTGLVLGLTLLAACGRPATPLSSDVKIIGGRLADDHRFMAGVIFGEENRTSCGGTFVTPQIVVTAAHCSVGLRNELRIRPGSDNVDPQSAPLIPVKAVIVHPQYDAEKMQNDIALMILAEPAPNVEPIAFNQDLALPADAQSLTVIGRGNTSSFGWLFDDLVRQVDVKVIPLAACQEAYSKDTITDKVICAGDLEKGTQDSCQGDSGGPLVTKVDGVTKLVGVVSWGIGCAQAKKPGVYTHVAAMAGWLEAEIAKAQAPLGEPTGERVSELFKSYCYHHFAEESKVGAEPRTATIKKSLKPGAVFQPEAKAPAAPAGETTGDETCSMPLLDGQTLTAALSRGGEAKFRVEGTASVWESPAAAELKSVSVECSDSLQSSLLFDPSGGGYLMTGANHDFFDIGGEKTTPVGADAFVTSCRAESGFGFDFIVDASAGGLTYATRLIGTPYGAADGKVYTVSKSKESPGVSGELLQAPAAADAPATAKLILNNTSTEDIFTWELSCNFAYELTDEFGVAYASQPANDRHAFRFVSPAHAQGTFLKGTLKQFAVKLPQGPAAQAECRINEMPVSLSVR